MWSGLTSGLSSALQSFDQVPQTFCPTSGRLNNSSAILQAARDVVQIRVSDVEEEDDEGNTGENAETVPFFRCIAREFLRVDDSKLLLLIFLGYGLEEVDLSEGILWIVV